jgi:hypothetical protein
MERIPKFTAKFVFVMLAMTIVSMVVWQEFVTDRLYNCTDALWFDFLRPGFGWVHGNVAYVPVVVSGRSMSEPDTIKAGWTMTRLWLLWFSFIGVSVAVSLWLAWLSWLPKRWNEPDV